MKGKVCKDISLSQKSQFHIFINFISLRYNNKLFYLSCQENHHLLKNQEKIL